ncbi:hypothetical protein [Aureibacillus halotolerans]|uniref:YjcQ protein n=1 Tax=Aureibacillus halotolerans TaxID=1508390 RepID=A0A4R6TS23_9BACI|nr:hypothetical protein [Aureibacillus halotolerans]TDQ35267.1 hypothetical protein EV213_12254 [Aureibacillus halotolerans]
MANEQLKAQLLASLLEDGFIDRKKNNIENEQLGPLVEEMKKENLIANIAVDRAGQGNKVVFVNTRGAEVTSLGHELIRIFQ